MTFLHAVVLGVVQGVTEFLPVSSDGHLALFQALMPGLPSNPLALDVALHVGTLGSMAWFFRRDLARMGASLFRPEFTEGRREMALVLAATAVTGLVGFSLKGTVEPLAASLPAAGAGFFLTAVFLAAGEWSVRRRKGLSRQPSLPHALLIGLAQGLAVWPGLSRSGSTIAAALLLGWSWENAGRLSFLMAMPAVAGATLLTARDMTSLPVAPVLVGVAVSFFAGLASLAILMKFLASRRLWPFAVYTGLLAPVVFCYYLFTSP